jgi:hypothetical protein
MAVLLVLFGLLLLAFAWGSGPSKRASAPSAPSDRECPGGHGPLVGIPTGAARSYEVFACTTCDFVETTVHGARSPLAYCPSCKQRALLTELARGQAHGLGQGPSGPSDRITVTEHCQLCGHTGLLGLLVAPAVDEDGDGDDDSDGQAPDNVLPFPASSGSPGQG